MRLKKQWLKKIKSWHFVILERNESNLVNILGHHSMSWELYDGFQL